MNKQNIPIKFFDFSPEISEIGDQIKDAINRVIYSGRYILGNEVLKKSLQKHAPANMLSGSHQAQMRCFLL